MMAWRKRRMEKREDRLPTGGRGRALARPEGNRGMKERRGGVQKRRRKTTSVFREKGRRKRKRAAVRRDDLEMKDRHWYVFVCVHVCACVRAKAK